MLSAIKEIAENRLDEQKKHMETYKFLRACNLLFEEGILSEKPIMSLSSPTLVNMRDGYGHFTEWRKKVSELKPGICMYYMTMLIYACLSGMHY